ncbi:hypothetical protein O181_033057 [Austropuccinia psidii MF-1]|uniref:Uncharacterized protein n=1 Tax=Austropuccinia psidii MF-1 TaxID=1389203 RepID=A0A9Q3D0N6_9BASI|nr:hypothetical protein [Austropuccinia psidii MF-1]
MKEIHGRRNWPWWKSQIIKKYQNVPSIWKKTMSFENDKYFVYKDPYDWCRRQSKRLKGIDPQMNIHMRNHKLLTQMPGELEHSAKKKVYSIEKPPEEESPTEDSDSYSIRDAIREQSDEEQDPRDEFLVEYQEETPLEIQDIQLEEGMPQDTANKNLCKHKHQGESRVNRRRLTSRRTAVSIKSCFSRVSVTL